MVRRNVAAATDKDKDNMSSTNATLESLNQNDNAAELGGILLGSDGQGNQLWAFGEKCANRFQDPDGGDVLWSADIEGWNYLLADALD